ncbi:SpoIIE family protein phosphatase [Streptomyces sp. DH37]|uniref:ATP-binding SpoIIE family protein phosphatase n=1 Tax=Streptomyces sp. DH37 TaxID=3040122 RepID=UPI00244120AB|nr:SpoIIE family protein phosphatase [Streptomyces sp. DH37]MDG9704128.1 SpoIIE family protein phosphatase [Streptomyces sp. DH37]
MNPTTHSHGADRPSGGAVVFVLDGRGSVLQCTATVLDLAGRSPEEVRGRPMADLVTGPGPWDGPLGHLEPVVLRTALRHRDGTPVEVDAEVLPLPAGGEARCLVFAVPVARSRRQVEDQALVRALFTQDRVGLVIRDTDLVARRVNLDPQFFGLTQPRGEDGLSDVRLEEVLVPQDAAAIDEQLRRVLETGEPLIDWEHSARRRIAPGQERAVSVSAFRLQDTHDRVIGVAAAFTDVTEQYAARQRLALLHAAAARLGRSLDVTRNAEELAGILVPGFADLASVDLSEAVFQGDESGRFVPGTRLQRLAVASADGTWPADVYQRGETVSAREAESEALREGKTVRVTDMAAWREQLTVDSERLRLLFPPSAASALFVPLYARSHVLGVLGLWRDRGREPFTEDDVFVVEEIASRAALSLDNARRYTMERRTTEALQRSLLPPAAMRMDAVETSGRYAPASTAAGTGGSWYDVIRLSGVRTAFVVGRVAGHGVHAAGAMGRLRSAVQTLADLDPPPEELLSHLDDLVTRIGEDEHPQHGSMAGSLRGATCLYATYDPVTGQCLVAGAGHPPPILVRRHTCTAEEIELQPGPPLGGGAEPFETTELLLHPGDILTFHSGPLAGRTREAGRDLERLCDSARAAAGTDQPLTDVTEHLMAHLREQDRDEDLALLLARVGRTPSAHTAFWQLPADPGLVTHARALASAQLADWGLEELTFSTELIVSELVTNAVRHAGGPIGLRLIKGRRLVCEVTDPSQSQPHLRRARLSDEGGRGLLLVAQLTHRWGSRYTPGGKTVWTEQLVEPDGTGTAAP